ncbi:MAG: HEAT repeat domain-containing protein [Anaerolineales bacterium]|nr:HEAT repeat domain-containing protein [Anaerolineales bacterium]
MPLFGCSDVARLRAKRNVRGLARLLRRAGQAVACDAAQALGTLGDPRAVAPLSQALDHPSLVVRQAAVRALGALGGPQASAVLGDVLLSEDDELSQIAAQVLGAMRDEAGLEPLGAALTSGDLERRQLAIEALSLSEAEGAVNLLLPIIADADDPLRVRAIEIVGRLGGLDAVEPLMAVLNEGGEPSGVAARALHAIAERHPGSALRERLVVPYREALAAPDESERREAAAVLEALGWQPGRDEAAARFWIAQRDWEMCAQVGNPAVPELMAVLEQDEPEALCGAAGALSAIGDLCAWDYVAALIGHADATVREAAARVLGQLAARQPTPARKEQLATELSPLLRDGDERVRIAAFAGLSPLGDVGLFALLAGLLMGEQEDERCAGAWGLGRLKHPRGVGLLLEALGDPNDELRALAAEGLGSSGDDAVVRELVEVLVGGSEVDIDALERLGSVLQQHAGFVPGTIGTLEVRLAERGRELAPFVLASAYDGVRYDAARTALGRSDSALARGALFQEREAADLKRAMVRELMDLLAAAADAESGEELQSARQQIREMGERLLEAGGTLLVRHVYDSVVRSNQEDCHILDDVWRTVGE